MKEASLSVTLLNPDVLENLYRSHGEFARVCYDTPAERAEQVGRSCAASGHMSGSRCEYIKFRIDGIDRGTAEQCMRHEIGVNIPLEYQDNYQFADAADMVTDVSPDQIVKNMASFRYIDKDGFDYAIPQTIRDNPEALHVYTSAMDYLNVVRRVIKCELERGGTDPKQATQDVNFVLPRATATSLVIGFTPEALVHFCHKRLCTRAQEFIREVAMRMVEAVKAVNPRFASELRPQCDHLLWCPEGKQCCGRHPTRAQLLARL